MKHSLPLSVLVLMLGLGCSSISWAEPPVAQINAPNSSITYAVGDAISFSGSATDAEDGPIPSEDIFWSLFIKHCPVSTTTCHSHLVQTFEGNSGSFIAPDHEYPSSLELTMTATDSENLSGSATVTLQPKTVTLTLGSVPDHLSLNINNNTVMTPSIVTVIQNSQNFLSAPTPQQVKKKPYNFVSWSDGVTTSNRNVTATQSASYTATFVKKTGKP